MVNEVKRSSGRSQNFGAGPTSLADASFSDAKTEVEGRGELLARGVYREHHRGVISAYSESFERIKTVRELIWNRHFREGIDRISKYGEAIVVNCRDKDPLDIYEDRSLGMKIERVAGMIEEWAEFENKKGEISEQSQKQYHEAIQEVVGALERVYDRMLRNDEIAVLARLTTTKSVFSAIKDFESQHGEGRKNSEGE